MRGLDDFEAYRTDVIFLCLIYPVVGIAVAWLTFGYEMLPLLFPLASGFALVGPVAAVGLYEMSRRREQGIRITWADAFRVVQIARVRCDPRVGIDAVDDFSALAAHGQFDLPIHSRPGAAGLDRRVRPRRVHHQRGLGDDRDGSWALVFSSPCWCWRSAWCRFRCCSTAMLDFPPQYGLRSEL